MSVKAGALDADDRGVAGTEQPTTDATGPTVRPATVLRPVVIGAAALLLVDTVLGAVLGG